MKLRYSHKNGIVHFIYGGFLDGEDLFDKCVVKFLSRLKELLEQSNPVFSGCG